MTCREDGTIQLWETATGRGLLTLEGYLPSMYPPQFNANGTLLAIPQTDGTAKIVAAANPPNRAPDRLTGHSDIVYQAAFNSDGSQIATASYDGTAKVWDAATGGVAGAGQARSRAG